MIPYQIKKLLYSPILYIVLLFVFIFFKSKKKENLDTDGTALSETKKIFIDPKKPQTISANEIKSLASSAYKAMCDVGTDEETLDTIYDTVKKNTSDVKALYNAFGAPAYNIAGSPMLRFIKGTPLDLKGWLRRELSGQRLEKWLILFDQAGIK